MDWRSALPRRRQNLSKVAFYFFFFLSLYILWLARLSSESRTWQKLTFTRPAWAGALK